MQILWQMLWVKHLRTVLEENGDHRMSVDGLQVKKLGSSGRYGAGVYSLTMAASASLPVPPASPERSGTLPRSDIAESNAVL